MRFTTALKPLCLSAVYSTIRVVPSGSSREYIPGKFTDIKIDGASINRFILILLYLVTELLSE